MNDMWDERVGCQEALRVRLLETAFQHRPSVIGEGMDRCHPFFSLMLRMLAAPCTDDGVAQRVRATQSIWDEVKALGGQNLWDSRSGEAMDSHDVSVHPIQQASLQREPLHLNNFLKVLYQLVQGCNEALAIVDTERTKQ